MAMNRAGFVCVTPLRRAALVLLPSLVLLLSPALPRAEVLTAEQRRGRQIYHEGTSVSGELIQAILGEGGFEVPASMLPCANCHGRDGRGRSEGGIRPTNLTWNVLTKPYGVTHESGRHHPPYTESSLKRAIISGIDPAGNELHVAMPRFLLSHRDAGDLIAYLEVLGRDLDPGLTADSIRLGTFLPTRGPLAGMGAAVGSVLEAYFAKINEEGGIYDRRVDWRSFPAPDARNGAAESLRVFVESEEVFALAGVFMAGAEAALAATVDEVGVPLVGPFSLHPQVGFPLNRHVFYLYSGVAGQALALVKFAARDISTGGSTVAVVRSEDEAMRAVAEAVREACTEAGWARVEEVTYGAGGFDPAGVAADLSARRVLEVFFLGSGAQARLLLDEAEKLGWQPKVFLPASLSGREFFGAPRGFQGKVFLSVPSLPLDQTPEGVAAYLEIAAARSLSSRYLPMQLAALCAARVLVEALRVAGRDVSREGLIDALEDLHSYETGLTRPITFGPNRRIGVTGAYVVALDLERMSFQPVGSWISSD